MNEKIDFVLLWVDGGDANWQKEKNKFSPGDNTDSRDERYRDWDNLKYWFRGVDKFAPWVNKIHFVTWGHLPSWLNTNHPKLNIVNHKDYIDEKYLPLFNCNPLEINLHKIKGIEEQFVYFNDDVFLIKNTKPTDFFKNNLPCDTAGLHVNCFSEELGFHFGVFRAIGKINKHFDMKTVIKENFLKWFNLKNGKLNLQTLILLQCPRFPSIFIHHLCQSFLKKTFIEVWEKESEDLFPVMKNKFRHQLDFTQSLFKFWQIAKGEFSPRSLKFGKSFQFSSDLKNIKIITDYVSEQKGKCISINDVNMTYESFVKAKKSILNAFEKILPEKSFYEL